jgi:hypothetical protein
MSSDFDTFHKYARRMKSATYRDDELSAKTSEALRRHLTIPILPNLCKLGVCGSETAPLGIADLFLGPKLTNIHIGLASPTNELAFVQSINRLGLSLRNLRIDGRYLSQAGLDLILGQADLESLRIGVLTPVILAHVATWSNLRRLTVSSLSAGVIGPVAGSGLTHITDLSFSAENVTTLNQFLSLCRPYQLRQLSLGIPRNELPPSSQWQQCFQTLSRYCSSTLEDLDISDHPINHSAMLPLLDFRNLTHLSMTCVFSDLDNARLSQMAQAWPYLQELNLQSPESDIGQSRITLGGILPVLKYCPKLRELALTVDATSHPCANSPCTSHPEQPWLGISNHNITILDVGNSVIDSAKGVAQFLSHILPNLEEINSFEYIYEASRGGVSKEDLFRMVEYKTRWEDVVLVMQNAKRSSLGDLVTP